MGTVPLLTREGEVEIARRIERGKLAVIKSISRTPTVAKMIIAMGDQLRAGTRTIRELVIFQDDEITDERVDERAKEVLKQIDAIRKQRAVVQKLEEKLNETAKGTDTRQKRKYRKARWAVMRAQVELSQLVRQVEFTELVKRRLIEQIKDEVESVRKIEREAEAIERQMNPKGKKAPKLKEEDKKNMLRRIKDLRAAVKVRTDELEQTTEHLRAQASASAALPVQHSKHRFVAHEPRCASRAKDAGPIERPSAPVTSRLDEARNAVAERA
jgi:RNA polymerase primary sigma factor